MFQLASYIVWPEINSFSTFIFVDMEILTHLSSIAHPILKLHLECTRLLQYVNIPMSSIYLDLFNIYGYESV